KDANNKTKPVGNTIHPLTTMYKDRMIFLDDTTLFSVKKNSLVATQIPGLPNDIGHFIVTPNGFLFLKRKANPVKLTYAEENGKWKLTPTLLDSLDWFSIFYNDNDSTWWVGGRKILDHYDKQFRLIRKYTAQDGIIGTLVLSILNDTEGNIWFTTNHGRISKIDSNTGEIITLTDKDGYLNHSGQAFA